MRISDWSSDVCLPISASAAAAPEKLPALYDAIDGIVADLRDKPVGDDELHRAREPMVERFRQSLKTNRGWYGMMLAAAYSPETINDALTEVEVVQGVTPARLQELARQYLVPDKAKRISAVPSDTRSEEHTPALPQLMRTAVAVFSL